MPSSTAVPAVVQHVSGTGHIFSGTGDVQVTNVTYQLPPAEAEDWRKLLVLLHKVRSFWVQGVLEHSLHETVRLALGRETRPETVEHPLEREIALPDQSRRLLPPEKALIEVFDQIGRSLLILGEPGAGKTTTLLELARDLLARADANPTQPVPVVFSLSTWAEKRQPLVEWLVGELSTKYHVSKKLGREWLDRNRILLLLDGLDEVRAEYRAACVEAINAYAEAFGIPGLVVTSRTQEYTALPVRLRMSGAICLQPLTHEQVDGYLARAGASLSALRSVVRDDPPLQDLAQTPLMLNVMSLAYQDVPLAALVNEELDTVEERREHIFSLYIERMFGRKGKAEPPYPKEQVTRCLSWLAQRMMEHGQKEFLIEQLQPSWLPTRRERWTYFLQSRVAGMVIALAGFSVGFSVYFLSVLWFKGTNLGLPDLLDTVSWVLQMVAFALLFGSIVGLLDASRLERKAELPRTGAARTAWNLMLYMVGGLFLGLLWWQRMRKRSLIDDIQPVETSTWSWRSGRRGAARGVGLSVVIGGMVLLLLTLTHEGMGNLTAVDILNETVEMLSFSPIGGVIGALVGGWETGIAKNKHMPNQGIRLSARSALKVGCTMSLVFLLPTAALATLYTPIHYLALFGLGGLFVGLSYGGLDVIQHYVLRLVMHCKGHLPWNIVVLLDHATKLVFLQKVGGGYRFIHGLLQEHFAASTQAPETCRLTTEVVSGQSLM